VGASAPAAQNVGEYLDRLAAQLRGRPSALALIRVIPRRLSAEQTRAYSEALIAILSEGGQ
jgi:hypothetical protein